eukprot:5607275-Pleurochrysis_carterae.AAC.2
MAASRDAASASARSAPMSASSRRDHHISTPGSGVRGFKESVYKIDSNRAWPLSGYFNSYVEEARTQSPALAHSRQWT